MKKQTLLLIFLFAMTASIPCLSQNDGKFYRLGYYKIDPENRVVYGQKMIGGTDVMEDGSIIHWDGYAYVPVPDIDYDKTSLIIFGNFFTFDEHFHSRCNIYKAKILRMQINDYGRMVVMDKKRLYTFHDKSEISVVDISKYKHITDCVFQDEAGKLHFLYYSDDRLTELTQIEDLDLESLTHVVENYYMDKNGLYFFGRETSLNTGGEITKWNDSGMLEKSNGRNITPIVSDGYLIYDDAVYSTKDECRVCKLEAGGLKLNELRFGFYTSYDDKDYYITDGGNIYRNWGTSWAWQKTDLNDIFQSGEIDDQPQKWRYIGTIVQYSRQNAAKDIYLPSADMPSEGGSYYKLYHTASGFYTTHKPSSLQKPIATKKDNVFVRNYDTKQYEPLDLSRYRPVFSNIASSLYCYIYKGRLYSKDGLPIMENIDTDRLERITYRGQQTNFFGDGRNFFHEEDLSKMTIHEENGDKYLKFTQPPIRNVDWKTLRVINENMMVDRNNIYYGNNDGLQIIPIEKLGMRVVIFTDSEAML